MSKFKFIQNLLENEKFDSNQKERFLKLVSKELEKSAELDNQVLEDIRSIKKKIGLIDSEKFTCNKPDYQGEESKKEFLEDVIKDGRVNTIVDIDEFFAEFPEFKKENKEEKEPKEIENQTILANLHQPKELVKLLSKFSENGNPLKYATHSWEMGQGENMYNNLDDFLSKLKESWKEISWDIKQLNKNLSSKIYAFILSPNLEGSKYGWGSYGIKFGWNSPDLSKEVVKQKLLDPSLVQLPLYTRKNINFNNKPITIQRFDQVVQIFKSEIEIRDEDSFFENLIINLHDECLKQDFIFKEVEGLKKANFYTDTDYLRRGIKKIMEGIKIRPQHNEVSYIMEDNLSDSFIFKIIQHNSYAENKSIYDAKFNLEKGDFGDIKNIFQNLCDWSIMSKFSEGNYRLNFLSSIENTPREVKLEKEPSGFIHILKFYKS